MIQGSFSFGECVRIKEKDTMQQNRNISSLSYPCYSSKCIADATATKFRYRINYYRKIVIVL